MDRQRERATMYKNVAKNSDELRNRRHDVTVNLRKASKDEQLLKRRNINENDDNDAQQSNNTKPQMTLEEIVIGMESVDESKILEAVKGARCLLSRERNPPIDSIISAGIVPKCVAYLDINNPSIQFEACWALTNIASGTSEQTRVVVKAGAVPKFIDLLSSPHASVADQSVWALGNISGDGSHTRDIVLNSGVIPALLNLLKTDLSNTFLQNITWLMSNLFRNRNPSPPFEKVEVLLPILAKLLEHSDHRVAADAAWACSYVSDDDNTKIQAVIDKGCVPPLINLLKSNNPSVIVPALRSIGNIVTGTDSQTDAVIAAGGLQALQNLFSSDKPSIVKETSWTISNITAGNTYQIQNVIDCDIFTNVNDVLLNGDTKSRKEAAWIVTNTITNGTQEQIAFVFQRYDILGRFCKLLESEEVGTIKVVLNGLKSLFECADKMGHLEEFREAIEELGCLDILDRLQSHENEEIYKDSLEIVSKYFSEENDTLDPTAFNGELQFTAAQDSNGFHF